MTTSVSSCTCLLPVTGHLVERLSDSLDRVLTVSWTCLRDMKDVLTSIVGAANDLLGTSSLFCDFLESHLSVPRQPYHLQQSCRHPWRLYRECRRVFDYRS